MGVGVGVGGSAPLECSGMSRAFRIWPLLPPPPPHLRQATEQPKLLFLLQYKDDPPKAHQGLTGKATLSSAVVYTLSGTCPGAEDGITTRAEVRITELHGPPPAWGEGIPSSRPTFQTTQVGRRRGRRLQGPGDPQESRALGCGAEKPADCPAPGSYTSCGATSPSFPPARDDDSDFRKKLNQQVHVGPLLGSFLD